jgi:hypothetical protein
MHTLQSRKDGFRLQLPDNFLVSEIKEKYSLILMKNKHFVTKPIDFLNETIQKVEVFGFNNASFEQPQQTVGNPIRNFERIKQNAMPMGGSSVQYRNAISPLALIDKTLNIEFRHTLGYVNYMMVLENFMYLYARDTRSDKLFQHIYIDIINQIGEIYATIRIDDPIINAMDMLSFDYSQPVAQSGTFKIELKYANFDYEFKTETLQLENGNTNTISKLPDDVYL